MIDRAPRMPAPQEKVLSPKFRRMIEKGDRLRTLLKGSDIAPAWLDSQEKLWDFWEKGRKPIASIIDQRAGKKKKVTVFDFGCANGFLLRSLQEWSTHKIEPYGIDRNKRKVQRARKFFPWKGNHFTHSPEGLKRFPKAFDVVFWNVWDNHKFTTPEEVQFLKDLHARIGKDGTLILGFYDHNKSQRRQKIERLKEAGFIPLGIQDSASGNETFAWFGPEKAV